MPANSVNTIGSSSNASLPQILHEEGNFSAYKISKDSSSKHSSLRLDLVVKSVDESAHPSRENDGGQAVIKPASRLEIGFPAIENPMPDESLSAVPVWRQSMLRLFGVGVRNGENVTQSVDVIAALPEIAHGFREDCGRDIRRAADFLEAAIGRLGKDFSGASGTGRIRWENMRIALCTRHAVLTRWAKKMSDHVVAGPQAFLTKKTCEEIASEVTERTGHKLVGGPGYIKNHACFRSNVTGHILKASTVDTWCQEAVDFYSEEGGEGLGEKPRLSGLRAVEALHCGRVEDGEALNSIIDLLLCRIENSWVTGVTAENSTAEDLPFVEFSASQRRLAGFKLNPNISLLTFFAAPFVTMGPYLEPSVQAQRNQTATLRVVSKGKSVTFTVDTDKTDGLSCGIEAGVGVKASPIILSAGAGVSMALGVGGSISSGFETSFTYTFESVKGKSIDELRAELCNGLKDYMERARSKPRNNDVGAELIGGKNYREQAAAISRRNVKLSVAGSALLNAGVMGLPHIRAASPSGFAGLAASADVGFKLTKKSLVGGNVYKGMEIDAALSGRVIAGGKPGAVHAGPVSEASMHLMTENAGLTATKTFALYRSDSEQEGVGEERVRASGKLTNANSTGVMQVSKYSDEVATRKLNPGMEIPSQTASQGPVLEVPVSSSDRAPATIRLRNWNKFDEWRKAHGVEVHQSDQKRLESLRLSRRDCKPEITYERVHGTWKVTLNLPAQQSERSLGWFSSAYLLLWDNKIDFSGLGESFALESTEFVPPLSTGARIRHWLEGFKTFVANMLNADLINAGRRVP
ncbi:hypothetical protein [Burkholderia sp. Bp8986]|uniref:hypothetical protein n=1 Tax=Burkholderia sp. Bp8986 TaxID=2184550 RepID=UPI000F59D017|nr:hypothetical protein [Burkholderia sp. Bp8986]